MSRFRISTFVFTAFWAAFSLGGVAQELSELESMAQQYYTLGDFAKAESYFSEVYKKTGNTNSYNYLLVCYTQLEQHEEAIKLAKKHFKRVNQGTVLVDLAQVYERIGDVKRSEESVGEAIAMAQERPEQIYTIASALSRAGKAREALTCYDNARKQDPNRNFGFQIAQLYGELGDVQAMFGEYLRLVDTQPNYLPSVRNMLGRSISDDGFSENNQLLKTELLRYIRESNKPEFSELLIWQFLQEKNYGQALRQSIALDKRYGENQKRVYELAETALNNKAYASVREALNYIIEVGDFSPYYMDAKILKLRSFREEMEQNYTQDLEVVQQLPTEYRNLLDEFGKQPGTLLLMLDYAHLLAFQMGNTDSAIALLDEAMDMNSAPALDRARCKMEQADILLFTNQVWDALLLYGQVDLDFKEDVIGQDAKFKRALVSYYQGDFSWAKAQFDVLKASTTKRIANNAMQKSLLISDHIALDTTEHPLFLYAQADLLAFQKQFDASLEFLDELNATYPKHELDDDVHALRYRIAMSRGAFQQAREQLEGITTNYRYGLLADDAWFQLGSLLEHQLADKEQAMKCYEEIITSYPSSVHVVEARKRFRKLRGDQNNTP